MKAITRLTFVDDAGEKFFGEGPCRLLREVEQRGSLRAAAGAMGMAYPKALRIVNHAEAALGFPLLKRTTGGKSGGGSVLTERAARWLEQYEAYRDACKAANEELYRVYFPKLGCVVMASGMGVRFGGNKLMARFAGAPMILRILDATEGLFACRVVVTRHEDVAQLCRERNIPVVVHDLPHRSDTIRLGLQALGDVDGCMFCPGDQPLLSRETVAALAERWLQERSFIWRTAFAGNPGSPVVFPRWAFPELLTLPEGAGGSHVIRAHADRVRLLEVPRKQELQDADSPEALEELEKIEGQKQYG